jgi:hypothetical protein
VALALQLEQTREKLLVLKEHLKGKKGMGKPRLRQILKRLDGNSNQRTDEMTEKYNNQSFDL